MVNFALTNLHCFKNDNNLCETVRLKKYITMKRIKLGMLCLWLSLSMSAQNYHTINSEEIEKCKTPQAIAWNFVMSIINQDYYRMESLCDKVFLNELQEEMKQVGASSYYQFFTEDIVHDIVGMRPVMREGWRLVCTDEYFHDLSRYNIDDYYKSLQACSVSFNCMKDNQIYSWQSDAHDTTARVILVYKDDKWQVVGFK